MPSITIWNRIEPRSRSLDLTEGLEARVQDPLWLLTRQWQVGEFQGRNAGSPVTTTVGWNVAAFDRFSVNEVPQTYDSLKPLETQIEQEAVRPSTGAADLRQAVEAGLYFARLVNDPAIVALCLDQYPLLQAAGDAQAILSVAAGRIVDGIKLHAAVAAAGGKLPLTLALSDMQRSSSEAALGEWMAWYSSLFSEPVHIVGWNGDQMEYDFALGVAGGANSYTAREYDGGAVDWYTFDRLSGSIAGPAAPPQTGTTDLTNTLTITATPVTFRGMPARRFWEMEDAGTNIGQLSAAAEDLGRLLLQEFALIYGNDWFQFPLTFPVGSEVEITSLKVVDTFGFPTDIPHYSAVDGVPWDWRMFTTSPDPLTGPPLPTAALFPKMVLLTPGAVSPADGAAVEEVLLLRDELANMVWGIERRVLGKSGQPFDRATAWNTSVPAATAPVAGGPAQYRLGSDVPDYWIPFLPVRVASGAPGGGDSVGLQRAKMPTPGASALGAMLQATEEGLRLEEVPREGVMLKRRYRYARGLNGSAYLWMGRERSVGKGEGRSGLRFDFLE